MPLQLRPACGQEWFVHGGCSERERERERASDRESDRERNDWLNFEVLGFGI